MVVSLLNAGCFFFLPHSLFIFTHCSSAPGSSGTNIFHGLDLQPVRKSDLINRQCNKNTSANDCPDLTVIRRAVKSTKALNLCQLWNITDTLSFSPLLNFIQSRHLRVLHARLLLTLHFNPPWQCLQLFYIFDFIHFSEPVTVLQRGKMSDSRIKPELDLLWRDSIESELK